MRPFLNLKTVISCAALLPLVLGTGCFTPRIPHELVIGPGYHPANIYGQGTPLPAGFRRVAVLPLSGQSAPEDREALGLAIQTELAKCQRFELVRISPEQLETWTGQRSLSPTAPLPAQLATHLRDALACDGLLLAELSQYRAYPPLLVGWNVKLLDLQSGRFLWAADEVFDAGQTDVANSARRYRLRHSQLPGPAEDSRFVLLSPLEFGRYSAEALFETLPPLPQPAPAKVLSPPADKLKQDRKAI